jgi:hypothetical protein
MPSRPPTLYCDEDVSVVLAAMLRACGFPVTTTRDGGYLGRTDEKQLHVASDANQILVTHNRAHFERLHCQWLEAGRRHAGMIIARRRQPSELTGRLGRLLDRLTADDFTNQLFYA